MQDLDSSLDSSTSSHFQQDSSFGSLAESIQPSVLGQIDYQNSAEGDEEELDGPDDVTYGERKGSTASGSSSQGARGKKGGHTAGSRLDDKEKQIRVSLTTIYLAPNYTS